MRTLAILLLGCVALRADFAYRSRSQITGGKLHQRLAEAGPHATDAVTTTRMIKGDRMAILAHGHTTVIDARAATVTTIDFSTKTYTVTPLAEIAKRLDQAEQGPLHEASFKVDAKPDASSPGVGLLNVTRKAFGILGASGKLRVDVDTEISTVPGYEQMADWVTLLAGKMGASTAFLYASGLADWALEEPPSLEGLNQALKQLNQMHGARLNSTIAVTGPDGKIAEVSIELSHFAGGLQDAAKFVPPAAFKEVDSNGKPVPVKKVEPSAKAAPADKAAPGKAP